MSSFLVDPMRHHDAGGDEDAGAPRASAPDPGDGERGSPLRGRRFHHGPPPAARSRSRGGRRDAAHRDERLAPRTRRILHLDCDAFLASVEQAVHPELRGRPVIVGGLPTERNLVMSCSYDARALGVRPGMLLAEAARRCPRAVFRRGDSQAANKKREEIARLLLCFSPCVEVASIDDFFVDLTGSARLLGAAFDVAVELRRLVREETAMPVTVGIATSRTMARLAGKLAKPGGVAELWPGYEERFLQPLPVEQLPGVGHRTQRLLERFAIRTVGDLALVSREVLFASFGTLGLLLHERARGIDPDPVEPTCALAEDEAGGALLVLRRPRTIRRDSTFEPEEGARARVEAMLSYLVERAAHRLREHGLLAGSLEVRLAYVDTRPPSLRRIDAGEGGRRSVRRALARPSDATDVLWRHARALFRELPRRRALVKRVGVTLAALAASPGWQGQLFSDPGGDRAPDEGGPAGSRADRQRRIDAVLDRLRARHGFGRVLRGASFPLIESNELGEDGFRLRTPSLNQ